MEQGKAIKDYIQESIKRKGLGSTGMGLKTAIDQMIRYYFNSTAATTTLAIPTTIKTYIQQEVLKVLKTDKKSSNIEVVNSSSLDTIQVISTQPPLGIINGHTIAFGYIRPVKIGSTYPYTMQGNTVIVQGEFEGLIGKAQRYNSTEDDYNFFFHPRNAVSPGGFKPDESPLPDNSYMYPLVDNDQGTRAFIKDSDNWELETDPAENYGNVDWVSKSGVLSWRGPSGRQLQMNDRLSFPGFTTWDYTSIENSIEIQHYTPYRNFVYQAGEIIKEFPEGYKVLGCALRLGVLICIVSVDYAGRDNPDGGTDGFYDEVWLGEIRIGWRAGSRSTTPWFFNSIGSEAIKGNEKVVISEDGTICSFSALAAGSGSQLNTQSTATGSGSWGMTRTGNWPMYKDYQETLLAGITLNIVSTESSAWNSENGEEYGDLPLMYSGEPPTSLTVLGDNPVGVGSQYTVAPIELCPNMVVEWSFSGGTIDDNGEITAITGCGMGTVTATISGGGFSLSGSKEVRLPSGDWYLVGDNPTIVCSAYNGVDPYESYIVDNTKLTEMLIYCSYPANCEAQYTSCPYTNNPKFPYSTNSGAPYYIITTWHAKVCRYWTYKWRCN